MMQQMEEGIKRVSIHVIQPVISDEEKNKAQDAIIVAIGITAVLIANVAYVGWLTLPGGSDPYWGDCFYPLYLAYICLNGAALVFSTASIAAVTFGPFVLIVQRNSAWRTLVVHVGLCHLGISLLTFVAAFACSGFVNAGVGAPQPNCAHIRCSQGGITCQPSYVQSEPGGFKLDPTLALLNGFLPGHRVFCSKYDTLQLHGNGTAYLRASDSNSWDRYGDNDFTLWCVQSDGTNFRQGGVPVPMGLPWRPDDGRAMHALLLAANERPDLAAATPPGFLIGKGSYDDTISIKLLEGIHAYSPGNQTFNRFLMSAEQRARVDAYLEILNSLSSNVRQDPVLHDVYTAAREYLASANATVAVQHLDASCTSGVIPSDYHMNYGAMRYVCSGGERPTLCDYGEVDSPLPEPLAVDKDGNYMSRSDLVKYASVEFETSLTTADVRIGVVFMIMVCVVANLITLVYFCFPIFVRGHHGCLRACCCMPGSDPLKSAEDSLELACQQYQDELRAANWNGEMQLPHCNTV